MHKHLILILTVFTTLLFVSNKSLPPVKSNADQVKDICKSDLKQFILATELLFTDAKRYIDDSCNKQTLITGFINARLAYKRLEYLAEYYAPATCKLINGPFLYKSDEEDPSKAPRKPDGFQVIEDQLFAADTIDKYDLETICYRLKLQANRLFPMVATYTFTDPNIWWASRLHLVRIMSMGITGFDSPSARKSIQETRASLESIKKCWEVYAKSSEEEEVKKLWVTTSYLFKNADAYLSRNKNYEKFNRLEFISDYLNPLYANGLRLQKILKIDAVSEPAAIAKDASNVFTTGAWNIDFFRKNNDPNTRLITKQAALGKLLFFDPILSSNGQRSCSSCHNPAIAFAENTAKSMAMDGKGKIKRNAPALVNAALQANLFAEGRLFFLEDQINDVVFAADELHGNFKEIARQLKQSEEYKALFAEAFAGTSDSEITGFAIIKSIAEYERTLISVNSKFDKYMQGDKKALNTSEIRGFNIFSGKGLCATCHFMPLFNGSVPPSYFEGELEVLGVPADPYEKALRPDKDLGRRDLTGIPWQNGSFKTPGIRNVALTAPYMHNGAYKTLEDVVDFYNRGGGRGLGLDVPNQTLPFDKLNLTKQEQKDIVNFMKALTDTTGLTSVPQRLPEIPGTTRKIGGVY